jgi:hypothetical protein
VKRLASETYLVRSSLCRFSQRLPGIVQGTFHEILNEFDGHRVVSLAIYLDRPIPLPVITK